MAGRVPRDKQLLKIYTKTGDGGETSLFGGKRVGKDSLRIDAYGTVDELNSHLGLVLAQDRQNILKEYLAPAQEELFVLGADLATPRGGSAKEIVRISSRDAEKIEKLIDAIEEKLRPLDSFILPGGSLLASHLHVARTVCRRAERLTVALSKTESIGSEPVVFLNRLSDFLFVLARYANARSGDAETPWHPRP